MCIVVRMPRTDDSAPKRSTEPRHRKFPELRLPEGKMSWGLAWKVCAFVPMVLLFAAMIVRVAGDQSDAAPEAARGDDDPALLRAHHRAEPDPDHAQPFDEA